jgi:type VI secretion system protein VasG
VEVNLKSLIGKLNDTSRRALEGAAGQCLSRTNYNDELEHWLAKAVEDDQNDLRTILKHFEVNEGRLNRDLLKAIDALKTGNSRPPALSPSIVDTVRAAWVLGSIEFGAHQVRTGHMLLALVGDPVLARLAREISSELAKVDPAVLKEHFRDLTSGSPEEAFSEPVSAAGAAAGGGGEGAASARRGVALEQFTIDLTAQARGGKLDPVLGRDSEIRQVIDILTRRRQNNPILTGEAGVGKTAVVEGFALRVAQGDVPPSLRNVAIRTLDLGLLQAGAGMKGEFENRLKTVLQEVKASPVPIILFIDEAHTLIGAGGAAGQGDAANLLKPALARGELRTIAATTWAEYKRYFEKDAALSRRFQVVKVEEPSEPTAVEMLRGLVATLEKHHGVHIMNEAVVDAVKLSSRYLAGRQLPDKAVSLLDTACARIGLSQSATPAQIEDCQRRLQQLDVVSRILQREEEAGANHGEALATAAEKKTAIQQQLAELNQRWQRESELVQEIRQLRDRLAGILTPAAAEPAGMAAANSPEAGNGAGASVTAAAHKQPGTLAGAAGGASKSALPATATAQVAGRTPGAVPSSSAAEAGNADARTKLAQLSPEEKSELRERLIVVEGELRTLQGEQPLVHPYVTSQAVAETVAGWTGIPVGRMVANEIRTVLELKSLMERSIIGQSHALDKIAQSIRTSRANLRDPRRPIGVFLLAGTSGVGKTETAITLAQLLYGGEQNMTVINMSEFKEEHKVSLLMGSPPGYVGYGEGGVLTEAVRRKPYSVLLLDEMEKAHPGVQDIFYQVFDKGTMKDGEGRDIDFKNTVIIMTTNAGTDFIKSLCGDPDTMPGPEAFEKAIFPELLKTFKPAFLGRLTVVPYYPLSDDVLKTIVQLKLGKIEARVRDHYRADFSYSPALVETIAARCTEVDTGARNVDHILTQTLLPDLSTEFLARMAEGGAVVAVHITVGEDGSFRYEIR